MKNQGFHNGLGEFLASKLHWELISQNDNGRYFDLEFRSKASMEISAKGLEQALGEYYSPDKEIKLRGFDESTGAGSLFDAQNITHSIAFTAFRRRGNLTLEEI